MSFINKALFTIICGAVCGLSFACSNAKIVGKDLSGKYQCSGVDKHDGKFTGVLNLLKDAKVIGGVNSNYKFTFADKNGKIIYTGFATVGKDNSPLAVYFSNQDLQQKDDYGVATIAVRVKRGKITLDENYYQPVYYGGNYGTKECVLSK